MLWSLPSPVRIRLKWWSCRTFAVPSWLVRTDARVYRWDRAGNRDRMFAARNASSVLALSVICVGMLLAGCASTKTVKKDVTITSCTASPTGGHPKAAGTIKNHSGKDSAYTIHVKFKDSSGNDVGDGIAAVAKVDSGTTAHWDTTGSLNAKGPVKCTFGTLLRTAVP